MTLYEMTANAEYLYSLLESGEIDEQTVTDTIDAMCVEDKLEDYCKVIGTFKAEIEMYTTEESRLAEKRKKAEKNVARLEKAVLDYMTTSGTDKKKCGTFDLKVTRSSKTRIVDENSIDAAYISYATVKKIDKAAILKTLRGGGTVAGCELELTNSIKIK